MTEITNPDEDKRVGLTWLGNRSGRTMDGWLGVGQRPKKRGRPLCPSPFWFSSFQDQDPQERVLAAGLRACLHLQQNSPTHQGFETLQVYSTGLAGRLKLFLGLWPLFHADSFWKPQDSLSSHSEQGDGEDSQNSRGWVTFGFIRNRN
ncbi:uncharacterized protein LOC128422014 isoform X1 [Podarcis raffonei]|uniref:uncharacterized protein LOC128422014 isoform X1 n=1 Tax=Podarcis raffonei TaxID=65483 RepID=UPI0023296AE4|nr:uncharacterized protein LOC128422014 isoform X1 [Podarcis raffonei]